MSDDNQLENLDKRKLVEDKPHQEGEWTEIGEAEVTVDIFGHAKVHVIRQGDQARRNSIMAAIGLAVIAVAAAVYMLGGKEEPVSVDTVVDVSNAVPAAVIAEPAVSAVVAPAIVTPPPVIKPQPRTIARVTPPPAATTVTTAPVLVAKPVVVTKPAPIVKPKPVVVESVPTPAAAAVPPELASPIQPAPAKPQGDITY